MAVFLISWLQKMKKGGAVNERKLTELPYHLKELDDVPRLVNVLCDPRFTDTVFRSCNFDLLSYYSIAAGITFNIPLCCVVYIYTYFYSCRNVWLQKCEPFRKSQYYWASYCSCQTSVWKGTAAHKVKQYRCPWCIGLAEVQLGWLNNWGDPSWPQIFSPFTIFSSFIIQILPLRDNFFKYFCILGQLFAGCP